MIIAYRDMPYEQAESYREVFRCIADGGVPLILHCSAGKDRTGIAAALLLLGVPRNQVIETYLDQTLGVNAGMRERIRRAMLE